MSKNIAFPFLILSLFLIDYEICQDIDLDTMKAIACISVIRKMENKSTDQRLVSGYLLTCFINIDEATARKLLPTSPSGDTYIEQAKIEELTDFSNLQTKYSQNDIMEYSKKLNSVLQKMQESNMGGSMGSPKGGKRDKNSDGESEGGGLLPFFINWILGLLNPNDSFLFLIGFFVLVFFLLRGMRKLFGSKKKNITDKKKTKKMN